MSGPARHTFVAEGWQPQAARGDVASLAELLRDAFARAGMPLPLLVAQTYFSLHGSLLNPQQWQELRQVCGGRLLLADEWDLASYPTCRHCWGHAHFAIGAQVFAEAFGRTVFMVTNAQAYVNLNNMLSRLHEDRSLLATWFHEQQAMPDCTGLIALVQDMQCLAVLREAGAEVYWRGGVAYEPAPAGIPLVAAPVCAFLQNNDLQMAPVLQALRHNQRVSAQQKISADDVTIEALLRMPAFYRGHEASIERGLELLERCRYHPDTDMKLPPSAYADPDAQLELLCRAGIDCRYAVQDRSKALDRLRHELSVIKQKQFSSYILIVYELAQQRRTCGRGSGASSIICYSLGLTNVDPIRYNLVFERFMAPEREDPPDIDLDFPWDERDAVFSAAVQRFGRQHLAMVCTHLHYRKWSAMREVARVHDIKREDITDAKHALSQVNNFGGHVELQESWRDILSCAEQLYGVPRHYGLHPGGLVITECPVHQIVPTHPSKKIIDGLPLPSMAWEKDGAENMGLLKIDILGNRSLAVIRDTIDDLREHGIDIHEDRWRPQDDVATRRLVAHGETMGCFYIESPAMRQLNAKAGSGDFDRLVVHSSIVRPAANNYINIYLQRLHEYNRTGIMRDEWFVHPVLRNMLSESFGVLSYQEDVMLVARELAGFSSAEQNYLRKSLGRSDSRERLQAVAESFHRGALANGVSEAVITYVWSMISSFAGYSFCKAHSASYAMVSFQCAYLKAHHPAYFMARVISNGGGFYDRSAYVEEIRRLGVRIKAPCVQHSVYPTVCADGGRSVRLGFHCVSNLQRKHAECIIAEREKNPFISFSDFLHRCPMSMRELLLLEQAGAFNVLLKPWNQRQRIWIIKRVCMEHERRKKHSAQTQSIHPVFVQDDPEPPELIPDNAKQVWRDRFSLIGCLPYKHPLCLWPISLRRRSHHCGDLSTRDEGREIEVLAWSITGKRVIAEQKKDRRGQKLAEPIKSAMCFATLEDETGLLESTWFPKVYQQFGRYLSQRQPMWVRGTVQVEFGFVSLQVSSVRL